MMPVAMNSLACGPTGRVGCVLLTLVRAFVVAFVPGLVVCESNGMTWHWVENGREEYSLGMCCIVQVHMPMCVNS